MGTGGDFEPEYRRFVRGSADLFAVANAEGYFVWLSQAWTKLGWTLDELKARPFFDLVHPDDHDATHREMARLAEGDRTIHFVNRYQTKSGEWRYIEWSGWPEGEHIYAIAHDITEVRRALATAERQVETLELAEEIGNFGHWRVDPATGNADWSLNVYRIYGVDPATFDNSVENAIAHYHPDDRARVQAYVQTAVEQKAGWDFRLRLIRGDGEERVVRAIGRVELDAVDNVTGIFGVFQDITDQERAVLARHAELEQFAYTAAHDLQAPLRTMLGFLSLLEEELGENTSTDVVEYLTRLKRSANRMRSLVGELYRYARAVGKDGEMQLVELDPLLESVLQEREADLQTAGAEVQSGALPSVLGVAGPLASVFANLVDNAIKYRSPDRPLKLRLSARPDGAHVQIDVEDNGIGFDPAHSERVFGLFKQLDPANSPDGMGVGLALCKKVMERHGGSIEADPRPGEGTTFRLRFPRAAAP
jgi:PAS domain S-box-containing protein